MFTPQQALQQYFGFDQFREGQEAAIRRVLAGQHTLLVMPTGSGKSLTYQLPALLLPGLTLVLSPLIALMKDQVDSLTAAGLKATYINSSLPGHEVNQRMRAMLEGHLKLLYIAPERLRSRQFTKALANVEVSLLAVDEAHCISQWGHDFRPDYLQIGPTWQAMGRPTLLATTATATPAVQKDVVNLLGLKSVETIVTGFNRPNLTYRAKSAPDVRTKLQTLQTLLNNFEGGVAIVYTATRRNAEEVADFVNDVVGLPAQPYHAGLDRDRRYQTQTDFMNDDLKVVVATNAFGMGVDKPDVRIVVHYNMPATVEAYYQEAGRAGRDGLPAECVLLFAPDDFRLHEWLINNDTPTYDDLHQVYHRLAQAANGGEIFFALNELAEVTGLHQVKIRVILSELELAGAILHMGNQGGRSHWKILSPSPDALKERSRAIDRRAKIRTDLLKNMINYAHLISCRRNFLLNYFGDASLPRSPRCCDNHTDQNIEDLPKAVTPREWFPLIVLETVRSLPRPVGRTRLAQILNGSRAKAIHQFGYDRHKFYGKLGDLSQPQISELIAALIEGKYLRIVGGELPVLTLSPVGVQALEARAALPVRLPTVRGADDVDQWRTRTERSDTVTHTFQLFQQDLTPAEIAAERELAESTIYSHLARLIAADKVALHDVVSPDIEAQVVQAVAQVGRTQALSPLKAVLPPEVTYGHIKCVLAAHYGSGTKDRRPETEDRRPAESGEASHRPTSQNVDRGPGTGDRRPAETGGASHPPTAQSPNPPISQSPISNLQSPISNPQSPIPNPQSPIPNPQSPIPNPQSPISNLQSPISNLPPSSPDTIILEAVAKLGGVLGRTGLAQFLTGSRAAWLETFADHSYYGTLPDLSQKAVINIIDALITDGRLQTTGGNRPKVITPAQDVRPEPSPPPPPVAAPDAAPASTELAGGAAPVELKAVPVAEDIPPASSEVDSQADAEPDQEILEALRAWRTEQARIQQTPPYIIFPNKVLEAIAAQRPQTKEDLAEISGIGPKKLAQYGESVLAIIMETMEESRRAGEPGSRGAEEPESRGAGEPESRGAGEPGSRGAEEPESRGAGEPESRGAGEPGSRGEKAKRRERRSSDRFFVGGVEAKSKIQNPKSKIGWGAEEPGSEVAAANPDEAILAVVSDLEGLITPQGLADLLTAAPDDVVSFSDHPLFGALHGEVDGEEVEARIEEALQTGQLLLSSHGRLTLA